MPARVTQHLTSSLDGAGMLSIGFLPLMGRHNIGPNHFLLALACKLTKHPEFNLEGILSPSLSATPSTTALPNNLRSDPNDNKSQIH